MVHLRVRCRAAIVAGALALVWPSLAWAAPPPCSAETSGCVTLNLTVQRAGDRVVQPDTQVTVAATGEPPAWTTVVRTDPQGRLTVVVPAGRVRVVVLTPGFERFDAELDPAAASPFLVVLEPSPANLYRTIVSTPDEVQAGVTARRLSREEIATVPGSQGDALRALQTLPGVARTPGGLGLLVLRGASPSQSVVYVGEHRVPRAFHALAISSVVPADLLDEVELVPSNFSSRYGNGTGGAVVLRPRAGRRDGVHGYGEFDLGAAGGMLEGPLGGGSFAVAAQRSYIDAFLRTVEVVDPNQSFVLPSAWDYQLFVDQPVGHGTTLGARVLGSEDRILSRYFDGVEKVNGPEIRAGFHRVDLELRHRSGPWTLLLSPSFRFEHQSLSFDERASWRRDYVTSGRAELRARLGPRARLTFGADLELAPFSSLTQVYEPTSPFEEPRGEHYRGLRTSTGLYAVTDLRIGRLSLVPGVRLNAFTLDRAARVSVDPRLLAHLDVSPTVTWSAGVGLYSQPETDFGTRSGISFLDSALLYARWQYPSAVLSLVPTIPLSPDVAGIRLAQALQTSTAVTYAPSSRWTIEAGAYLRLRQESLGVFTNDEDQVVSRFPPASRNYGVELLLRRQLTGRLYGWVSYSLSWARRLYDQGTDERLPQIDPFDQRHNLAVVASYALPRHWRIGGRFRLVSGSPYTPIVDAIVQPASFGVLADPFYGEENSARFPMFHQLDLRVDKRWYVRRTIVTGYLDVQNIYNRQNVEAYLYSPDFQRRDASLGLPILPSLGLRVDF